MRNIKNILKNKFVLISLLLIFTALLVKSFTLPSKSIQNKPNLTTQDKQSAGQQDVLGNSNKRSPQIFVTASKESFSAGGMIALAATDEPSVNINSYDMTGKVDVSVYEANEQALLDYLTHDKDGKQTKKNPDINKFRFIKKLTHQITKGYGDGERLLLPIENGIFFLKIEQGSVRTDAFVVRSNIGTIVKEGDNEFIFWAQNFKTLRSMTEGTLSIYNLQDNLREIGSASFDNEGIAKTKLLGDADIAIVRNKGEIAVVPINLDHLNGYNYNYKQFQPKTRQSKYFIFTDRPLYRPGDTIHFKSIVRDDDDARYTIPTGQALVKFYESYGEESLIFEKNFNITEDGTVYGEYQLPDNAKTGNYHLTISITGSTQSSNYFDVQFFRKPEYSIDVTTPKTELVSGDQTSFTISGNYFSGQPLTNQKVKYKVYSTNFYEYEYLIDRSYMLNDDYRYGYWGGEIVTQGEANLDKNGQAEINLNTKIPKEKGKNQVFSIEAEFDNGSGNPSYSRKNILVYAADFDIYRKDRSYYSTKINTQITLPVTLVSHRSTIVSGIKLTAYVHRQNWVPYDVPNQKYPEYRKEEESLPPLTAATDSQGNAAFMFTPTKIGSYDINVEGHDKRDNKTSKVFYSYVSSDTETYYSSDQNNDFTIQADKQKYDPTDTVQFKINSTTPDRDIFLSLERGRVNRFQIVKMSGKTATVDIPLVNTDIPNIYAKISSFSSYDLDTQLTNVIVSADSKKLVVNITPDRTKFGPGENVTINVETKDTAGNPVSSDVALWTVDKALFELVDAKPAKIFDTFWSERYDATHESHSLEGIVVYNAEKGGCFTKGTQVLMSDKSTKSIEKIKKGDTVLTYDNEKNQKLTPAKVKNTHEKIVDGYFILNGNLSVTSNHRLWVNNTWRMTSEIQIGDTLLAPDGQKIKVTSIEWMRGKYTVYNLEIEKYGTYFAGGVWVHNQKGGANRTIFKDTAYWNPSLHTDSNGHAQVTFQLPDNLTTWVIAAVGANIDTRVGQTTNELVVSKNITVRPILPNILRAGDDIVVSVLVQNSTENDQIFDVSLKFDSGDVKYPTFSGIAIKSKEMQQIYWDITPKEAKDKAKLTFSAVSNENKNMSDTIVQEIPVREFGFYEQRAQTGEGQKDFAVKLAPDSHKNKSDITLSLSPTLLGTLPSAMKYLVNYPYGCVEQTTSRFVPALIAKINPELFSNALENKNINDIIEKGLNRLTSHQHGDGGWTWWYSGPSNPFVTSYVVEYILLAKQSGIDVDPSLLKNAQNYLENDKSLIKEDVIAKNYALTILGAKNKIKKIDNLENLTPDILSLAVMTNYINGDNNPVTNGLTRLESMAQAQGDGVYWAAGNKINFASDDTSTALAIRAIITVNGNRTLAEKAARFLTRNRRSNYWSNTFATAQVIRSIVDFSKNENGLNPSNTYSLSLDGKIIANGSINNYRQVIKDIIIPVNNIKPSGSIISVTKSGDGQIYSTLVINEFHTDKTAKDLDRGLKITRRYINEKGPQYSLAVGDTVTVNLTISGLKTNENYGVITDELPAGIIPINQAFNNEQYGYDSYNYNYSYDVTDTDTTENGKILSLYQITPLERTYSYKARVISGGKFTVPPATVSLMYAPEIYGRSEVQTIEVAKESIINPLNIPNNNTNSLTNQTNNIRTIVVFIILLLLAIITIIFVRRKRTNK